MEKRQFRSYAHEDGTALFRSRSIPCSNINGNALCCSHDTSPPPLPPPLPALRTHPLLFPFFPFRAVCLSVVAATRKKIEQTRRTHTLRIHRCLNPFILYGIHLVGYMANIRIFFFCSRHSFLPETLALVCRVSSFAARRLHAERNAYNFSVESGNNRIAAKQQKFERGGGRSGCVWV